MSLAADQLADVHGVMCHDRVCVPDGRIGVVVGFYRREDPSVLVRFSSGESAEFLTAGVERLRGLLTWSSFVRGDPN